MNKGLEAERRAEQFLSSRGLTLVERNYRCVQGELDLIMDERGTTVFVEVRLRSHRGFASAAESVTATKQHKLRQAAAHFLAGQPARAQGPCRFDVLAFDGEQTEPHWINNAF